MPDATPQQFFATKVPYVAQLLRADFGLDRLSIAAILGNLGHESAGFTELQERNPVVAGSRGGWGWAQWTGPRRRKFEVYCARNGFDPASEDANYKWLFLELSGSYASALDAVREAGSLNDKVVAFEVDYLRAGIKHYDSRQRWAELAWRVLPPEIPYPAPRPNRPAAPPPPAPVAPAGLDALDALLAPLNIIERFLARQAIALVVRRLRRANQETHMNFLSGYKTYVVAALMIVAGAAQIAGVEIPVADPENALHLIMEGFAVLFLRRGLKTELNP